MSGLSRRGFVAGGLSVAAAATLGARAAPGAEETSTSTVAWEDLGYRSDELTYRVWFAVAQRGADNAHYIYSGTTRHLNSLLRFDPVAERWVIHKQGSGERPWFPDPGAEFPAPVDNGLAVWDNVNDELWVTCVNPWGKPLPDSGMTVWRGFSPAIFNAARGAWREVTAAEFPTFDFETLPKVFNPGCAAGPGHTVVYGGRGPIRATLWVYDGKSRVWTRHVGHGEGRGKPGHIRNIQNQLRWIAPLGAFLLYAERRVFTLSLDWKWEERTTTGEPPLDGRAISMVVLPGQERVAVVGGRSADVWLLDLRRWDWSRLRAEQPLPPLPRYDGCAWGVGAGLYVAWGREENAPAALIRRTFRTRLRA